MAGPTKPKTPARAKKQAARRFEFGIPVREKILFSKHLSVMIHSGLPLREGLEVIRDQTHIRRFRTVLDGVIADVDNGQFLSVALGKHPRIFDELYTSLVRVGEESGRLSQNLSYLSSQLERADALRRKIVGAMLYPAIILVGTLGVVAFLTFVTLPQLLPIFSSLNVRLPPTTQFLFSFSRAITQNIWVIGGILVVLVVGVRMLALHPRVRLFLHFVILKVPIVGRLMQDSQITRFSQIIGTLLAAGVDVVRALEITGRSMGNLVYRTALLAAAANMSRQGETIAQYLVRNPQLFPSVVERMVRIGEKTGKLDESLIYISEFYDREIDNTVRNLTTVLEPTLLLIMGLIVGFVAISVITPIYEITKGIGRR